MAQAQVKPAVFMDKAGIEKAIKSIAARGLSLDKDIQVAGISILAHISQHKEVSLFKKLYDAMPKGSRAKALIHWAISYGQVSVNFDKKTSKAQPFLFNGEKILDLQGASEKPWFDCKKEKSPAEEFSFEAEVLAFQRKVQLWIKAGKVSPTESLAIAMLTPVVEQRSEEVEG